MRRLCDNCGVQVGPGQSDPGIFSTNDAGDHTVLCTPCSRKEKRKFELFGFEMWEGTARASGNGAIVNMPKRMVGKRMAIVRLE